jgi:hypothetical protein
VNLNTYIALFFILLFGGKLLVVDSGVIEVITVKRITVAKPFCKKKGEIQKDKNTPNQQFQQAELILQQLSVASLCSPQIKRDLYIPKVEFVENKIHRYNFYTLRLNTIYLDHLSPPPKQA